MLAGDDRYRERADRLFDAVLPPAAENLFGHAAFLNALDLRLRHKEIVATGERAAVFADAALRLPFLDRTVLRAPAAEALSATHPAREQIAAAPRQGAAFICIGESCSLPITDPNQLATSVP